ncbi:HAD-IA family hydrolase [Deinococcus detaillensis]|nr:HAD-IA family hydrolase [Deinococcus detaillensis]
MTRIKAVLFDRDDTLSVMDASVYHQAAEWAAEQFGLEARTVLGVMRRHWETEFGGWWALRSLGDEQVFWQDYAARLAAGLGLRAEQGTALVAQFPYHAFMKPAPQARGVLLELRRRGLKTGVLSNTLPDIWPTLQAIGVADVVNVALSSCLLGVHKPEAEVFLLAAQVLEVEPAAVLFLDDKLENVLAARAVGMRAELVDLSGQAEGAIWELEEVLKLV